MGSFENLCQTFPNLRLREKGNKKFITGYELNIEKTILSKGFNPTSHSLTFWKNSLVSYNKQTYTKENNNFIYTYTTKKLYLALKPKRIIHSLVAAFVLRHLTAITNKQQQIKCLMTALRCGTKAITFVKLSLSLNL